MTTAAHAVAVALAWALSWRAPSPGQRRLAAALSWLLTLDLAEQALRLARGDVVARAAIYAAGGMPPPYVGSARASWAVGEACMLAWYAVATWGVWAGLREDAGENRPPREGSDSKHGERQRSHFPRHPRIVVTLAFLASSAALFALYPIVRGRPVEILTVATFDAALAVQLVAAARFVRRRPWSDAHRAALVLVASSVASFVGAWWQGRPVRDWDNATTPSVAAWLILAVWEGRCLIRSK